MFCYASKTYSVVTVNYGDGFLGSRTQKWNENVKNDLFAPVKGNTNCRISKHIRYIEASTKQIHVHYTLIKRISPTIDWSKRVHHTKIAKNVSRGIAYNKVKGHIYLCYLFRQRLQVNLLQLRRNKAIFINVKTILNKS